MGHKKVCFNCRKAFSIYKNPSDEINLTCPECGGLTTLINHKFRPPMSSDIKKRKVAEYLRNSGCFFHHVYEKVEDGGYVVVSYPETMTEAVEFVRKYKHNTSPY